jgi:hypothetical protein
MSVGREEDESRKVVPEVVGAPSVQGAVVVHAQCDPGHVLESMEQRKGFSAAGFGSTVYTIPAHCPVFSKMQSFEEPCDVIKVTAIFPTDKKNKRVAGVSIDGLYNGIQQANGNEGANRFAMAISGLVTLAARPDNVEDFEYGDEVFVDPDKECVPALLQDTMFTGRMHYTRTGDSVYRLGTFVCPVDSEGGMRVMLNLG